MQGGSVHILVVEDAPHVRQFLVAGLRAEGHELTATGDLASARAALATGAVEFLVVDRGLPDGDGLDLVRGLRREGQSVPTICLTARDRVDERVEGLRSGVDDYLVKPFSFEELLARVEAVRRRTGVGSAIEVGPLHVDISGRVAMVRGKPVALTAREFDLLVVLARHPTEVMSRSRLLDQVWGLQHDPRTNVVDVYVRYLRTKLGSGLIHTVRGVGYVLDPARGHRPSDP